ncbi:MAG TPA: ribonuclease HII [Candidatus Acidoferrales bacterium]|nr:ribonuclease HII [Candidatus Acidoferrales bacterium]
MVLPTFDYESKLWNQGLQYIAGVDEVGRGCFAGPVVAAAVILTPNFPEKERVNDSKKLSAKVREELAVIIKEYAIAFSIAEISVSVINKIGIGKAAQQAFVNAIVSLKTKPEHILIDAYMIQALQKANQTAIIHGDSISISIAAASIIAKVYRDELMQKLHPQYEVYDFFTNKGYGTKKHRDAIGKYGLCELHRTSFDLTKFLQS